MIKVDKLETAKLIRALELVAATLDQVCDDSEFEVDDETYEAFLENLQDYYYSRKGDIANVRNLITDLGVHLDKGYNNLSITEFPALGILYPMDLIKFEEKSPSQKAWEANQQD